MYNKMMKLHQHSMQTIENDKYFPTDLQFLYGHNPYVKGVSKLEPFEFQKNLWASFQNSNNGRICISQCRQIGMTTLLLNYAFQMSKIEGQKMLFVTNSNKSSGYFNKMLVEFYKYEKESDGSCSADLDNVQFGITNDLIGYTGKIIIDNASYFDFYQKLFGKEVIVNSCPRYKQDDFAKIYNSHEYFEKYVKHDSSTFAKKIYDENWQTYRINFEDRPFPTTRYDELKKMMPEESFNQEILGHFTDKPIEKEEKTISFRLPKHFLNLMEENMTSLELNQTDYFKFLIEIYNKK